MSTLKVSIIIPVYNVELYLREALDSVINQTLKEIEIIIVNDGSTDNSLEIVKEYETKDHRIIVINQENQGLSGARNSGLKIAKGHYIYFMDSDDYIALDTLEICYECALEKQLDFVFFDAQSFTKDDIDISEYNYDRSRNIKEKTIYSGKEALKKLLNQKKYRSAVWLNFIRLEYLDRINLKFYPNIIHEDELFTFLLFLFAQKTSYINRKFFQRRIRPRSIMTEKKGEKNLVGCFIVAKELKKVKLKEKNMEKKELLDKKIQEMIGNSINLLELLDNSLQQKYLIEITKNFECDLNLKNKIKLNYPHIFKKLKKLKKLIILDKIL